MTTIIRPAGPGDLDRLREVDRAAGRLFADIGMQDVAEDEPMTVEELARYQRDGRMFVAEVGGHPVGYAAVDVLDGLAHLEQMSVHPDHGRQGLGAALLDRVCNWSAANAFDAITLTTFRHVAWNAPYYERFGFEALADDDLGPDLRRRRDDEAAAGLDPAQRVCMRKRL